MNSRLFRCSLPIILSWFVAATALAQAGSTGTIEGRVVNTRPGEYVERARITIDNTGLETFSDSSGQYRLTSVPAGTVTARAFFTGLDPQSETITVNAGSTAWERARGLVSIWTIGMLRASPRSTLVLPCRRGSARELGPVVNDAYFAREPPERLRVD